MVDGSQSWEQVSSNFSRVVGSSRADELAGGGLGHLGIQFAKALGIKVIAIDARDEGLEIAKKFGADHVLDARESKQEVVKKVQALTDGKGVDTTVNVSDHSSTAGL